MAYRFSSPSIVFGQRTLEQAGALCSPFGKTFLVVHDEKATALAPALQVLLQQLEKHQITCVCYGKASQEPSPSLVDEAVQIGRVHHVDAVLAIGGGSVLDTAKAAAGMIPNEGMIVEYLEGVGTGRVMQTPSLPFIALPTTAGTGAEVTHNAVITDVKAGYKKSFRSESLLARLVIVDPLLAISLPPAQTAASGMDALTQLIESYVSRKHNPIADGMALNGIRLCARSLVRAYLNGEDADAREDMAQAALLSGLCLASAGLGAAHGIAASLGAHLGLGHGLACAILLAPIMRLNCPTSVQRFADIGRALTGQQHLSLQEDAQAGIAFVEELAKKLHIPEHLKHLHISKEQLPVLARDSAGGSMSGNPVQLSQREWEDFLRPLC